MLRSSGDGSACEKMQEAERYTTATAGGIHTMLKAKRQQGLPPTSKGQKQLSDKEHSLSAQAGPQECKWQWWGLVRGDSKEGCPPSPRQGVRDALGTIHYSDNEGTEQHSVAGNSWQWPLHSEDANQFAL